MSSNHSVNIEHTTDNGIATVSC